MAEKYNLNGKTALVTGALGNLGRRICQTLAHQKVNLILTDIEEYDLESFGSFLALDFGISVQTYVSELNNNSSREKFVHDVIKNNKNLDILINNAAYVPAKDDIGWATSFENQNIETWNKALNINLTAPFYFIQKLYPLLKNTRGSIINISSIYGVYGPDWSLYENTKMSNVAGYGVSKAGLIYLTKWLAKTLAPEIRVNSISPGGIYRGQPQEFVTKYEKRTPLKRMAKEDDILGAVIFLSSDMSSYITGQNIVIDGGWGV